MLNGVSKATLGDRNEHQPKKKRLKSFVGQLGSEICAPRSNPRCLRHLLKAKLYTMRALLAQTFIAAGLRRKTQYLTPSLANSTMLGAW